MTDSEAIALYERATGDSAAGCDGPELHEIVESVRCVRAASSEEEAISAILWLGHSEEWTRTIVSQMR